MVKQKDFEGQGIERCSEFQHEDEGTPDIIEGTIQQLEG